MSPNYNESYSTSNSQKKSTEVESLFWSGIGMLLYLITQSIPNTANAVCKCMKTIDGSIVFKHQYMLFIIKYELDKMKPLDLVCYHDKNMQEMKTL